jgi:putative hemolysin
LDPSPESIAAWQIWILVALIVGSFFFAGTETALTSLGEAKARQLRDRLGRRGRVLGLWIDHPQKVLTALLIGNNTVNIAASAMATAVVIKAFGSAAVAIATGILTLVIIVIGEIIPKTLAREHAEKVAVTVLRMLQPFYYLVFPFAWILVKTTGGISRAMGGGRKAPAVTSEDIDYLIGLGSEMGALEGVKRELLNSVLEFTDLRAKEIMVPRTQMVSLEVGAEFDEVLDLVENSEHSRIPVFEGTVDNIVGVLHVKDLLHGLRHGELGPEHFELRPWVRAAFFVPEVMKVSRLMKEMQRRHTHLAVVVDEFGGTSGIVTLEDVVEEIVGEIQDEHDVAERPVKMLPDGKLLVDAGLPLRELEEVIPVTFPEDGDYETLGGFLTATAGQVPPQGSLVAYGGFTFTVREADEKRVHAVEVSRAVERPDEPKDDDAAGPGGGQAGEVPAAKAGNHAAPRAAGPAEHRAASGARFFYKAT